MQHTKRGRLIVNTIIKMFILLLAAVFMAVPAMAGDSIDGAKFFSKKCKMCHAVDKKKTGPAIKSMSQDDSVLRDVISHGGKNKMMKAYGKKFSAEEIDALVEYLRSVAVPSAEAEAIDGAKLFSKKCKMCHAVDKKKTGPSLKSMHQDKSVLQDVISNGSKKKRMMKAYGKKFSPEQIDALVDYIQSVQ